MTDAFSMIEHKAGQLRQRPTSNNGRRVVIGDVMLQKQAATYAAVQSQTSRTASSWFQCLCCRSNPPPPPALYCSAVSDASDSESEASFTSSDDKSATPASWKDQILKVSNYASLLCVLDCTLLPLLSVALPIISGAAGAASALNMEWLHELGHKIALYFVLPVGLTASTSNYVLNHRKKWITAIAYFGLTLVLIANSGSSCGHHHHHHHHHVQTGIQKLFNAMQHGIAHRISNITGCALLILSNYISRKRGSASCGVPNCTHDHDHSHSHEH